MYRRVFRGLPLAWFVVLGAGLAMPRMAAAAALAAGNCSFQLERCTDNGIGTYDDCVCNADANAPGCLQKYAAPSVEGLAPAAGSSVAACVAGLQLDLSKCLGAYLACEIIPQRPMTAR